ncbi:MAG: TonB-dependent receptor, partial [Elusimicrobia bacterium]|nr:TonB-dependent receptor [Elusimicrobiota bacterium]
IGFEVPANAEPVMDEELLFMEIPTVVSASKAEQPIEASPSTIYVITAEDIKQSGALKIQDVLRMAPGMDYVFGEVGGDVISPRGFYDKFCGRTLVLVDGRSIYIEFFGELHMDEITNLSLEDIERIEIIRGPGSALYGANAYNGVISIFTKSIEDSKNANIKTTVGEDNTFFTNMIHADTIENFGYKVVVREELTGDWRDKEEQYLEHIRGYVQTEYKLDEESKLGLSGGRFRARKAGGEIFTTYVQMKYNNKDLQAQMFFNQFEEELDLGMGLLFVHDPVRTIDGEIQYSINWMENNNLIYGCDYRGISADSTMLGNQKKSNAIGSFFLQNEYNASDKLTLYAGGRFDYHSEVDNNVSPRVAGVYSLAKDHVLRASYGTAFRNPNLLDLYYNTNIMGSFMLGNEDIEAEQIQSAELGYRGKLTRRIKATLDLFYNKLTKLIEESMLAGNVLQRNNLWDAYAYGGEAGLNFLVTDWLSGLCNYSYQYAEDITNDVRYKVFPRNKVNAGLRCRFENGITAKFLTHYVEKTEVVESFGAGAVTVKYPAYTLINARIGCEPVENLDISLAAYNLFNDPKIRNYSGAGDAPVLEDLKRKVTATVSYKF